MRIALPAAGILLAGLLAFAPAAQAQPLVSADWLRGHLNDAHVVVLDLRPAAQHDAAHIPGAVAADYEKGGWRVKLPDGAGGALPRCRTLPPRLPDTASAMPTRPCW